MLFHYSRRIAQIESRVTMLLWIVSVCVIFTSSSWPYYKRGAIGALDFLVFHIPYIPLAWSASSTDSISKSLTREVTEMGLHRVLNFIPETTTGQCLSANKRRQGMCMNTYDCQVQSGEPNGLCALGFGVCCIFSKSCDGVAKNNLTYVANPGFPTLIDGPLNCTLSIRKVDSQVSQLRIDFLHFNIGQPNQRTGICDDDVMQVRSGNKTFQLCGWNSGQHVYVDMEEDLILIEFHLPSNLHSRIWEMRLIQLQFEQRAPSGCFQYFQDVTGTLKTFNYLTNGRYLAGYDYLICIRQEKSMCSISYTQCTNASFRIGIPKNFSNADVDENSEGSGIELAAGGSLRRCTDRILIPCDLEELITPGNHGAGICDLEHCGSSLCNSNAFLMDTTCHVETSVIPFNIRVAFGPGVDTGILREDNAGMCVNYKQLPCVF